MKTIPYNRHETFLAALSDSSITVPTPLSREELYLAKIAGEDVTIPTAPYNRYETYLAKLAGENVTVPTPVSRLEYYLYKACGNACDVPVPANREELFWQRYAGYDAPGTILSSVDDAVAAAAKNITINITPIQKGYGTPSSENVRDLQGFSELTLTRCGMNLFSGFTKVTNAYMNSNYMPADFSVKPYFIVMGLDDTTASGYAFAYDRQGNTVGRIQGAKREHYIASKKSFSIGASATKDYDSIAKVRYQYYSVPSSYSEDDANAFEIMCFQGDSNVYADYENMPYEAYNGATYTIDVSGAGTVYGGTLDVTNGLLTVTYGYIESYDGEELPGEWISDRDVYAAGTTPSSGAEVVYKLDEEDYEIYQIQTQSLTMLEGINNIWSDAGPVSVTYIPDL